MNDKNYQYQLEKYQSGGKNRFDCPECKSKKSFTRYINTKTGEYFGESYGMCNRLKTCGYHKYPESTGRNKKIYQEKQRLRGEIPYNLVKPTLNKADYQNNYLIKYLYSIFDEKEVNEWCKKYFIGTNRKNGATIFWHCDHEWKFRQGQVVSYTENGKRDKNKNPNSTASMLLRAKKISDNYDYLQCVFGEHLLTKKDNNIQSIGFHESPKTALIAAIDGNIPIDLHLSHISITGLTESKVFPIREHLQKKNIYLFNDSHFQARMYNGVLPLRRKEGEQKLDKNGVIDSKYQNKKELIRFLTRKSSPVHLIDAFDVEDESGDDVADLILQGHNLTKLIPLIPPVKEPKKEEKPSCDICGKKVNKFFLSKVQNVNVCIDCKPKLAQKPVRQIKTLKEAATFLGEKYPLFNVLVDEFGLKFGVPK